MSKIIQSFHYRLAHPGYSVFPGAHPGQMVGGGQLFKRHEPLLASPDPRRIDLRASLLDPFAGYRVRVFQQHSKLSVYAIADLSASMTLAGQQDKRQTLAELVLSAAQSALQCGDSFGFIGCGQHLEQRWTLPAGSSLQPVKEMLNRLPALTAQAGADSLARIAPLLPARRSLVFLVSDYHFSLSGLRQILHPLAAHAVVPVILWQAAEAADLPAWGLLRFKDAESRRSRTVLMRPALKQRINQAFIVRGQQLQQVFRSFGMEPLFLSGAYRAEAMNNYFLQHAL